MRTLDPTQTPEYRAVMTLVCLSCGLAAIGSVFPVVEDATNLGMLGLGALLVLGVTARLLVRWVRERIEDADDARTAAAWRATHPRAGQARLPAGVS